MIAEVKGKINNSGSNLSSQMEDKLTGDVFGVLRYLSYEKGLKILLENINIYSGDENIINENIKEYENSFIGRNINFWPNDYKYAELDLSIDLSEIFIGVEVKYNSGLSSDDQLERELKEIRNKKKDKNGLLLFISREKGIREAIDSIDKIKKSKSDLLREVGFAYISWEDIYEIFNKISYTEYNHMEKLIIEDILRLLNKKGFERFKDFNMDLGKYRINKNEYYTIDYNTREKFNFIYDKKVGGNYYEFK